MLALANMRYDGVCFCFLSSQPLTESELLAECVKWRETHRELTYPGHEKLCVDLCRDTPSVLSPDGDLRLLAVPTRWRPV
jgi:hypothetical protein